MANVQLRCWMVPPILPVLTLKSPVWYPLAHFQLCCKIWRQLIAFGSHLRGCSHINLGLCPDTARLLAVSNLVKTHARSGCRFTLGKMPVVVYLVAVFDRNICGGTFTPRNGRDSHLSSKVILRQLVNNSYILQLPDCWLEVSIRKVLRPATSAQVFLAFPVSKSECWDGSQDSQLLLHASHVALPT